MEISNRDKIRKINEQTIQDRLNMLTKSKGATRNPIDDIIEGPETQNENNWKQVPENPQQTVGITAVQNEPKANESKIDNNTSQVLEEPIWDTMQNQKEDVEMIESLSSLQNRFGVRKIKRPVKDAQLTARIESVTLKRFKEIVKTMYYPDKPNINETVTQIIRAFVEEYDKNNKPDN